MTLFFCFTVISQSEKVDSSLFLSKTISDKLSPKSVVHNGKGLFFAQNMMYRHTITVYNRMGELLSVIKDQVALSEFGFDQYKQKAKGAPVECAFSHGGKYAWVSNYNMTGGDSTQFVNPGCDNCSGTNKYDSSFVYVIDTETLQIIKAVKVGSVPKYVAVAPNNKYVLVSNWSSGDVSVIDTESYKEVKRIKVGTFPRGIVIDKNSQWAFITVMGSTKIAKLNLTTFELNFIENVGKGPRHLCISPDNQWLYLTLNTENKLAKINIQTLEMKKTATGHQPRSMTISPDGNYLYVVNYSDNTFSKIRTSDLKTVAISETKTHPIGITYDQESKKVWVACYSGHIQVFKDSLVKATKSFAVNGVLETNGLKESDGSASVAALNAQSDTDPTTIAQVPVNDVQKSSVVEKRWSIEPIRSLYVYERKVFPHLLAQKEKSSDANPKESQKVIPIHNTNSQLDKKQPFLVIVGGFSVKGNAENKIEILSKAGIVAETFLNTENGLYYVFVYSSNSESEAKEWIKQKLPADVSSWILKQ